MISISSFAIGVLTTLIGSLYYANKKDKLAIKKNNLPKKLNCHSKPLPDGKAEIKLYHSIIEQLGDTYHIQFGTDLNSIVEGLEHTEKQLTTVDILIADPKYFSPKLAIFIVEGRKFWSGPSLLNNTDIKVLTLSKQDYYGKGESLITDILDSLRD